MVQNQKPKLPGKPIIVDESTDSVARRTFISLLVIFGFVAALWFLYQIKQVLIILVISLVVTLALAPAVSWFVKKGLGRGLASILTVAVAILFIAGIVGVAASPLVSQGNNLIDNFPRYVEDVTQNQTLKRVDEKIHVTEKADEISKKIPDVIVGGPIVETAKKTFSAVVTVGIIFTLTLFLLIEGSRAWATFVALFRPHHGARIDRVGKNIAEAVGGYVSGNLFISVVAGAVSYVVLRIVGVPFAFPLAVLVAVFDLIPVVGATIATVVLTLVALSVGVVPALVVLVALLIYQQVENNFIQPLVYARSVQLTPLTILVATVIGAELGGIIGVLLAIPAAAAIQIVIVELLRGTAPGRRANI